MKTLKDFVREILDLVPGSAVFQVWTFAFQTKIHPFYQIGGSNLLLVRVGKFDGYQGGKNLLIK